MRYRDNEVSLLALVDSIDPAVAPGDARFVFEAKARSGYSFLCAPAENYVLRRSLSRLEIPAGAKYVWSVTEFCVPFYIIGCLFSGCQRRTGDGHVLQLLREMRSSSHRIGCGGAHILH